MYYKICEDCGAWLDVGERCDCKKESPPAMPAAIPPAVKGLKRINEEVKRKDIYINAK